MEAIAVQPTLSNCFALIANVIEIENILVLLCVLPYIEVYEKNVY